MKRTMLTTQDEEMARKIANLKGKELEEYIADAEAVLKFINKRLKEPHHSAKMIQAYQETKKTLEALLDIVESNRSN
jgi:hypothetical protein